MNGDLFGSDLLGEETPPPSTNTYEVKKKNKKQRQNRKRKKQEQPKPVAEPLDPESPPGVELLEWHCPLLNPSDELCHYLKNWVICYICIACSLPMHCLFVTSALLVHLFYSLPCPFTRWKQGSTGDATCRGDATHRFHSLFISECGAHVHHLQCQRET